GCSGSGSCLGTAWAPPRGYVPFGSRVAVCESQVPAKALALPPGTEHEPSWKLLGQRPHGASVPQPENGMDTADGLPQPGRCPEGCQQLPDGILQSGAAPCLQWGDRTGSGRSEERGVGKKGTRG